MRRMSGSILWLMLLLIGHSAVADEASAKLDAILLSENQWHNECAELVAMGDKATKYLLGKLKSDDWREKARAAYLLGRLREGEAVTPLVGLLEDKDERVASTAISALGTIGKRDAVKALCSVLITNRPALIASALHSLLEINDPNALHGLEAFSSSCNTNSLDENGRKEMADKVISIIKRSHKSPESHIELLEELLMSENDTEAFTWALSQIRQQKGKQASILIRRILDKKAPFSCDMSDSETRCMQSDIFRMDLIKGLRDMGGDLSVEEEQLITPRHKR